MRPCAAAILAWRHGWRPVLALCAAIALAACAPGQEFVRSGNQLIDQGHVEEGLAQLEKAASLEPGNSEYRMALIRQREIQIGKLLSQGDAALLHGGTDTAESNYRRAAALDPDSPRALAGLEKVAAMRQLNLRLDRAQTLEAQGHVDEALQIARAVLAESPGQARAQALLRRLDGHTATPVDAEPALRAALRKPVTLDFRDTSLKAVFEALSRSTGLNFVFDREVRPDIKVSLSMANISVDDLVGVLTVTNQLERKTLNDNTILIYPNTPLKAKDYAELNVRTFYLANADAKSVMAMLKTVLKTRDLYADDKLNSLTMRDTPAALRLAASLIAAQDLPEPEVMLEVEVLEIKRSRLLDIGIQPPGTFTALNLVANPATVLSTATGTTTVQNNTLTSTQLTLNQLRGLRSSSIGVDNPSANLHAENGDTNILANPRIRVKNHEKARILIGDRVPVITTTSTANVGVAESVSYLDVGLKLEVEPNVYLDNEVGVKVNLEVSNIVNQIKSASGTLTYQIGTRLASTNLRLKDGETQALAGLISDEDRHGTAGVPGFADLPVLGRLLSTQTSDRTKTEIVLLITPRVVRNIGNGAPERFEYPSGTETSLGAPPLRVRGSGRVSLAPGGAGASPSPAPEAETEQEPTPAEVPPPAAPAAPAAAASPASGAAS